MHQAYGKQTDVYFKVFQKQWRFIQNYQADAQYHGIYELVGEDGSPIHVEKGSIWKGAYHDGRALLNVTDRLRNLAEEASN
jgi:mannobiose 2-epimerase